MIVEPSKRIRVGSNLLYDPSSFFYATNSGEIFIGDNVAIGFNVCLYCGTHDYTERGAKRHPYPTTGYDIHIEDGVWIASSCILVGPCTIGKDAVIGVGSLVRHDVPAGELWAGHPAQFIKSIQFKDVSGI